MDISIVIPSYNSASTIGLCLKSILSQATTLKYETIVVDSSDGGAVADIVRKYPDVIFIKEKNKTLPGIARNIGAAVAKGGLLVFMDSDIIPPPGYLEEVFKYYKEGHDVFSSSIDIWEKEEADIFKKVECFFEFSEFKPCMPEGAKWCLPSAALAIKRQLLEKEKFLGMETSEDVELTVRLHNKGAVLYFNPELKVFHIFTASFITLLKKAFKFGMGNMQVRAIHNVSGSKAVKNKLLAFFIVPFFAMIKFFKISWRNMIYNDWQDRMLYIITIPFTLVMILAWTLGFYKGLIENRYEHIA